MRFPRFGSALRILSVLPKLTMKVRSTIFTLFFVLFASTTMAAPTACPQHFLNGEAPDFVNRKLSAQSQEVCYSGFAVIHSGVTRTPLISAEHLTRARLAQHVKRQGSFHPDPNIPSSDRAELQDYAQSGYDRGHMAPARDMTDAKSMAESFTLANVVPQNPNNNQNLWEGIEAGVRDLDAGSGELYVVTGPIFYAAKLERINNRVTVPTYIFKAVYDPSRNRAAAYLVKNENGKNYVRISIPELEKLSGVAVFPKFPAGFQKDVLSLPEPQIHGRASAVEDLTLVPKS
jgi:endonuclease G, mitochondrial